MDTEEGGACWPVGALVLLTGMAGIGQPENYWSARLKFPIFLIRYPPSAVRVHLVRNYFFSPILHEIICAIRPKYFAIDGLAR